MVLAGVTAPEPAKSVYTKADVFPLIFDYYVGKADAILAHRAFLTWKKGGPIWNRPCRLP